MNDSTGFTITCAKCIHCRSFGIMHKDDGTVKLKSKCELCIEEFRECINSGYSKYKSSKLNIVNRPCRETEEAK